MSVANEDQSKLWNGTAGKAWVEMQELLDRMFRPLEDLLVQAVAARGGGRVLDVGCGTGSTTLAIGRALGDQVDCTGVDISEPMIALARQRAEQEGLTVNFVRADAQAHDFDPASFDVIVSRFGVMFFDDPVQAFSRLRHAASAGAELRLLAWRSAAENPFMTTAERAAAPLLPNLPARRQDAPGQFAWADPDRVAAILADSGWEQAGIRPLNMVCTMPASALVRYLSWLGPVGALLQNADEATRDHIISTVRTAFEPYVQAGDVRFTAACWMVTARRP